MVIPKKIKIGGLDISVEQVPGLAANRDRYGEYSFMEQKITIDQSLPECKKAETLVHEILEAINGYLSLNLSHESITILGFIIFQVIRDNDLNF